MRHRNLQPEQLSSWVLGMVRISAKVLYGETFREIAADKTASDNVIRVVSIAAKESGLVPYRQLGLPQQGRSTRTQMVGITQRAE